MIKKKRNCKDIKKEIIKKSISVNDYKYCLFNNQSKMRKMNVIRSHLHDIYTETVNKVALSHEDDSTEKMASTPLLLVTIKHSGMCEA